MCSQSIKSQLMMSQSEWQERNTYMSNAFVDLVRRYARINTNRGLDIGCGEGTVVDAIKVKTGIEMFGIDPRVGDGGIGGVSATGAQLLHGGAHDMPFSNSYFDFAILANVYEHIR